jgi:anti-anti-sigma factor
MLDLPPYRFLEKAFEGSETVLYRGRRAPDDAKVAIKLTRNEYPTARELARLRREFTILKEIEALPGVVRALALEKSGRGLALVMEDLGPCSLHELLMAQRLEIQTTLRIAVALSDTLASLHGLRVIHKDIKPRNILIDQETLAPRLIDFGIAARLSQETQKATNPDSLEGTLAYMSPEQTGIMNRAVDLRTDLYSLGATIYEMLTGAPPFSATDPTELINSHIARVPTPPHERAEEVPRGLSDIVMKLLAKMPEERYQSARGLNADLRACLEQREATGRIDPFPLGREDMALELCIPQKLYGREQETGALWSAFERAQKGAAELVLVSGYSGVGKSALVNELHRPIVQRGGYFGNGKFDQINRDTPLAPIAHAFGELLQRILTEPADALAAWKARILDAVGTSGRLLLQLIPELELLIGPQPEVSALRPNEDKNRFSRLVQRFVRAFAAADHPLCIFLDDLQWADPASLRLLGELLGDLDSGHLLVVGAYRDNEVDAAHPLMSVVDELRKAGAVRAEITLTPLELPTVTQLIADTLSAHAATVLPLAALVFDKTHGNPFFMGQFLRALHDEQFLWVDVGRRVWTWDLDRIRERWVTDNVVDLMLSKLKRLAPATQRALKLAASIGHEFDLRTLSTIDQRSPADTAADLWAALLEGLVLPLDGDYRFLEASAASAQAASFHVTYRFLHDRVLQAAYALIEPEGKEQVHHEIGTLLWARSGEIPRDEDLLEIVRHMNLGRRMARDAERAAMAQLNLRAGRKARAATAHKAAADYFSAGIDLLGDAGWTREDDLCFTLHVECAECAYLSGAFERAEALFQLLLPRARSNLARARVHDLRVVLYMTIGKFVDAVRVGREGLELLGFTLPEAEAEQRKAFEEGLAAVNALLGDRRVEDLLHAPVASDPESKLLGQLLNNLTVPFYYVNRTLYGLSIIKQVKICLEHGHSEMAPMAYMSFGFMLAHVLGHHERGHAFSRLALALHDRSPSAARACRLYITFALILYVREPARAALPYLQKAHDVALETGDSVFLAVVPYTTFFIQWFAGYQLDDLREGIEKGLAFMQRRKNVFYAPAMTIMKQVVANLTGRTRTRGSLSDDTFDEDAFIAALDPRTHVIALFDYHVFKLKILYLHGDPAGALAAADKAEQWSASAVGMYSMLELSFYLCLALLSLSGLSGARPEEPQRKEVMARHWARIKGLAESSPKNFQHKLLLLEAEAARGEGRLLDALELYDGAIALAKENEFPQDEALANELCAKAYMALGRVKAACGYMTDAHLGYLHWGAVAKATDLANNYGHVLLASGARASRMTSSSASSETTSGTTLVSHTMARSLRDASLIVHAAQAIASEVDLPRVIERLVKIVLENAAAQRGALLLEREGELFVEATFGVDPARLELGLGTPVEAQRDLAQKVVRLVARTRQSLVLEDASEDDRFSGDLHVAESHVRSILCLPLLYQGRLNGVMYLENKDAAGAFDTVRVEVLGLLSSQAGIAIENARMVASVRAANERVLRANELLETEVAERTEEIQRSNQDLRAANERLKVELTQREQAERGREELQAQMLEAQRVRLSELSTPLIPITDQIMVLPLIGTLDAERAAQVLEVVLTGAARHRARVVILDITGIKHIDTGVIGTLARTVAALRLLGAEAVITGISPEVAQAMVQLEVDMSGLLTMATLQSGIAFALQRSGRRLL